MSRLTINNHIEIRHFFIKKKNIIKLLFVNFVKIIKYEVHKVIHFRSVKLPYR